MRKRRYEILLPLKHNDGRLVSALAFEQAREELVAQFGGISLQPNTVQGIWAQEGVRYEDELLKYVVDVEDLPDTQQFFIDYKRSLLERFEQIEIYIISYPIERI